MLGKTAGGLYWMFCFLERSENTARLVEAGFRIALPRSSDGESEWKPMVTTAGVKADYSAKYHNIVDYLLRDPANPSNVISVIENARSNARMVRTALTTEVWEAVNETWMTLKLALKPPIRETELPAILGTIRRQSALVHGALHGTMLRNDINDFAVIGTVLERADNTARIIDVKYYTLLPSASFVGSSLDNVQWEMVLRSVSAHRAFRWLNEGDINSSSIASFLMLDAQFPRSLLFAASIW
jgi:uncharacterized alpha-E superfamily protein